MHCISSDLFIAFHQIYLHSTFQIHQQGSEFTVPRSPWGTVTYSPEMRSREKSAGPAASHLVTGPGQTVFLCELAQLPAWGAQLLPAQNLVLFPHIHIHKAARVTHPRVGNTASLLLTCGLRMAGREGWAALSPLVRLQYYKRQSCIFVPCFLFHGLPWWLRGLSVCLQFRKPGFDS